MSASASSVRPGGTATTTSSTDAGGAQSGQGMFDQRSAREFDEGLRHAGRQPLARAGGRDDRDSAPGAHCYGWSPGG